MTEILNNVIVRLVPYCAQKLVGSKNTKLVEGSLEVKLPTIWTDEKQRWKGSERREE